MIISKKQYEKAISDAKNEVMQKVKMRDEERDKNRWLDDEFCAMRKRMDNAFADIDRRLSALEKNNERLNGSIAVCSSKY